MKQHCHLPLHGNPAIIGGALNSCHPHVPHLHSVAQLPKTAFQAGAVLLGAPLGVPSICGQSAHAVHGVIQARLERLSLLAACKACQFSAGPA